MWLLAVILAARCLRAAACAQYPGQVTKADKDTPELRAIAVLEWTGDAGQAQGQPPRSRGRPRRREACRMAASIWPAPSRWRLPARSNTSSSRTARPWASSTSRTPARSRAPGLALAHGSRCPPPKPKPSAQGPGEDPMSTTMCKSDRARPAPQASRRTTRHRHRPAPAPASQPSGAGHRPRPAHTAQEARASTGDSSPTGQSGTGDALRPAHDHSFRAAIRSRPAHAAQKTPTSESSEQQRASPHAIPTGPVLKKSARRLSRRRTVGHVDSLPDDTDPDRPQLKRGKSDAMTLNVTPTLMGLPADLQQAVAVSDAKTRPEHPWNYSLG